MKIKLKLRKIGNSFGVILPKNVVFGYNIGDLIDIDVITKEDNPMEVITKRWWCHKHKKWNDECGCK